ncbi:MAG: hypothetical protein HWE22_07850 [Flavobacteriales bacterium]|nr:hypothetical protein [Flavobacteriales bacterium]
MIHLKTDLTNGERTDTLAIHLYNSEGNETVKIGFKRNKRYSRTFTKWDGSLKISTEYTSPDYNSFIEYEYDENKNLTQTLDITVRNGDTTALLCKQFTYDSNNNLIEKLVYNAQTRSDLFIGYSQKAIFEYDSSGNLVTHQHFSGNSKVQPVSKYYYTGEILDSIVRVYRKNSIDDRYDSSHFKYNEDGKLYSKSNGILKDEYSYDVKGFLKHACAVRDQEVITEVNYHYKNDLIHEVVAVNKNPQSVSSLYYFHSNHVKEIRDVYIRNENNHILSEERYFDGHLSEIFTFVYTYY